MHTTCTDKLHYHSFKYQPNITIYLEFFEGLKIRKNKFVFELNQNIQYPYSTREIISIYCASLLATDLLLGLNTRKKLVPSTIINHLKPEFRFPANESKSRITLLRNFMLHVLTILYWVQNRKCPVFFMLRIYQLRNSRTPRLSD